MVVTRSQGNAAGEKECQDTRTSRSEYEYLQPGASRAEYERLRPGIEKSPVPATVSRSEVERRLRSLTQSVASCSSAASVRTKLQLAKLKAAEERAAIKMKELAIEKDLVMRRLEAELLLIQGIQENIPKYVAVKKEDRSRVTETNSVASRGEKGSQENQQVQKFAEPVAARNESDIEQLAHVIGRTARPRLLQSDPPMITSSITDWLTPQVSYGDTTQMYNVSQAGNIQRLRCKAEPCGLEEYVCPHHSSQQDELQQRAQESEAAPENEKVLLVIEKTSPIEDEELLQEKSSKMKASGVSDRPRVKKEDQRALEIVTRIIRPTQERSEAGLPWRQDDKELPQRYKATLRRKSAKKKINADPAFASYYFKRRRLRKFTATLRPRREARKNERPIQRGDVRKVGTSPPRNTRPEGYRRGQRTGTRWRSTACCRPNADEDFPAAWKEADGYRRRGYASCAGGRNVVDTTMTRVATTF